MHPCLVFDLDGTLVDTAPDLLGALNAVLVADGRRPVDLADLRHLVGHGARAMLAEAFLRTGEAPSPERLPGLIDAFIAHYRAHIADESAPFPGVDATLAAWVESGARLGVLTNKPRELALPLLETLNLSKYWGHPRRWTVLLQQAGRAGLPSRGRRVGWRARADDRRQRHRRRHRARRRRSRDPGLLRLHARTRAHPRRRCGCRFLCRCPLRCPPPARLMLAALVCAKLWRWGYQDELHTRSRAHSRSGLDRKDGRALAGAHRRALSRIGSRVRRGRFDRDGAGNGGTGAEPVAALSWIKTPGIAGGDRRYRGTDLCGSADRLGRCAAARRSGRGHAGTGFHRQPAAAGLRRDLVRADLGAAAEAPPRAAKALRAALLRPCHRHAPADQGPDRGAEWQRADAVLAGAADEQIRIVALSRLLRRDAGADRQAGGALCRADPGQRSHCGGQRGGGADLQSRPQNLAEDHDPERTRRDPCQDLEESRGVADPRTSPTIFPPPTRGVRSGDA